MNKNRTLDVIIPVYKPGKEWEQLLLGLSGQTRKPERILVMNTGEEYWNPKWNQIAAGDGSFSYHPCGI